jgi:adenylylsulfate kinase
VKKAIEPSSITPITLPVIWLVGLSGSGKTTLAKRLSSYYQKSGQTAVVLDGDELRKGLNKDLGFSEADRKENLRRAAEVAKLFQASGILTICSFISPTRAVRSEIASILGEQYYEVFVNCSLEVCEQRDVKGLYKKARKEEVLNFTGISAAFETPDKPNLIINTEKDSIEICLEQLTAAIEKFAAK